MARETGLEPATSGVTGRRSNQLSYSPVNGRVGRIEQRETQVKNDDAERRTRSLKLRRRQAPARHFLPGEQVHNVGIERFCEFD